MALSIVGTFLVGKGRGPRQRWVWSQKAHQYVPPCEETTCNISEENEKATETQAQALNHLSELRVVDPPFVFFADLSFVVEPGMLVLPFP